MKYYSPDSKYNIVPKGFSLFPFFFAMAALSLGASKHSALFYAIACFFALLTIYTFFFARDEKYLDTDRKMIIKRLVWLWIKKETSEPLEHFKYIYITAGAIIPKSNWSVFQERRTYNVLLARDHMDQYSLNLYGPLTCFYLKSTIQSKEAAMEFAQTVSEQTGLEVVIEKHIAGLFEKN